MEVQSSDKTITPGKTERHIVGSHMWELQGQIWWEGGIFDFKSAELKKF